MNDILSTICLVAAAGAFFGLPAAVALNRVQTDRTADGVTIPHIPQQRDERAGGDA